MNDIKKLPILFESKFSFFQFDERQKILLQVYKSQMISRMKDEDYKKEVQVVKKLCVESQALYFIADTSEYDFPIRPALQTWTNENIFSNHQFLKKCALITSKDLIGNLGLKQTFDRTEATNLSFQVEFFDDFQAAFNWINEAITKSQSFDSKTIKKIRV